MQALKSLQLQFDEVYLKAVYSFSGDCIDVHISNLIEPSPRRLVRPVDSEHVQFLTEEFKSNSTSFVILAGFVEDDCDIPCLKEPDCGTEVEVIGGNHSRIALQYLLASGHLTEETVRVKLYSGLTDDEALGVGVLHNSQAQKSKKMTFMDVSRLIRDKLKDCPQEDMLKEKQKLVKIFGLKVSIVSVCTSVFWHRSSHP